MPFNFVTEILFSFIVRKENGKIINCLSLVFSKFFKHLNSFLSICSRFLLPILLLNQNRKFLFLFKLLGPLVLTRSPTLLTVDPDSYAGRGVQLLVGHFNGNLPAERAANISEGLHHYSIFIIKILIKYTILKYKNNHIVYVRSFITNI